jgi:RNA polymerase sigma-70 factor, ECF subfamily
MTASSEVTEHLVRRAIGGDRVATEELLGRYRPQLRRMVAIRLDPLLRARFDPSDVVQSVLAEAARKMMVALNNEPERFYPWLRQLAWDRLARLYRDHVRTEKRSVDREEPNWQAQVADDSMLQLADQLAARQLGPHSLAVREETRGRVRTALTRLPATDREVLVLRFLERLDITDTAAALGISESAVKSRQFRAIRRLGQLLHGLLREGQS